jgi:hypothetical protein
MDSPFPATALLEPVNDALDCPVDLQPVQKPAVDRRSVAEIGLAIEVGRRLNGADDRQVVDPGEVPVALILPGYGHDRTGPVGHQHVVGDPDRDARIVGRVHGEAAGEYTGLLLGEVGAREFGLARGVVHVRHDLGMLLLGRDLADERVLWREHAIGRPVQRVWTGCENREVEIATIDSENDIGPL